MVSHCDGLSYRHHHHHHVHHHGHDEDLDDEDVEEEEMLDEDEDEEDEDDDEDEDIDEDDEDMDFKMVFVVNKSLELRSGIMSLYVAKSTAGLFKKINAQPQSVSSNCRCQPIIFSDFDSLNLSMSKIAKFSASPSIAHFLMFSKRFMLAPMSCPCGEILERR